MGNKIENHTVEDLKLFMKDVLDDLQKRTALVRKKYKVSYLSVKEYLIADNPDLVENTRLAEDDVDGDIIARVEAGLANGEECEVWKQNLMHWKNLVIAGIDAFEEACALSHVA